MTQGANWANHNPLPSLLIETTENEIILLQLLVALAVFSESSKQGLYMHILKLIFQMMMMKNVVVTLLSFFKVMIRVHFQSLDFKFSAFG